MADGVPPSRRSRSPLPTIRRPAPPSSGTYASTAQAATSAPGRPSSPHVDAGSRGVGGLVSGSGSVLRDNTVAVTGSAPPASSHHPFQFANAPARPTLRSPSPLALDAEDGESGGGRAWGASQTEPRPRQTPGWSQPATEAPAGALGGSPGLLLRQAAPRLRVVRDVAPGKAGVDQTGGVSRLLPPSAQADTPQRRSPAPLPQSDGDAVNSSSSSAAWEALLEEVRPRPASPLATRRAPSPLPQHGAGPVATTLLDSMTGRKSPSPKTASPAAPPVATDATSLSSAAAVMLQRIQSARAQAAVQASEYPAPVPAPVPAPAPPPQRLAAPIIREPPPPPPVKPTAVPQWTPGVEQPPPAVRVQPRGDAFAVAASSVTSTLTSPQSDQLYPAPPQPPPAVVPPSVNTRLRAQAGQAGPVRSKPPVVVMSQPKREAIPPPPAPVRTALAPPVQAAPRTPEVAPPAPIVWVNTSNGVGGAHTRPGADGGAAAWRPTSPQSTPTSPVSPRPSTPPGSPPGSPPTDLVATIRGAQSSQAACAACTALVEFLDSKRAANDDTAIRIAAAGAAPAAVGVINAFGRGSSQACACALAVLRAALRPGSAPQAAACAGGAPAAVVAALTFWPHDQNVTREGCAALRVLVAGASPAAMTALANAGGIEALVGLLQSFCKAAGTGPPVEPGRTVAACEALWHLCGHTACVQTALSAGILPPLAQLLRSAAAHSASTPLAANVAAAACGLLQRLGTFPGAQADTANTGALEAVVDALFAYGRHNGVQAAGCAALWVLTSGHSLNAQRAGDAGGVEAAVQAVKLHPQSPALQGAACGALRALTTGCVVNQARSVYAGAFEAVVAAIRQNARHHAGLAESAASALGAMCGASLTALGAAAEAGAAPAVVDLMMSHEGAASVQAAAAFALTSISSEWPNARATIDSAGGLEALVRCLYNHKANPRAQEAACAALAILLAGSPERCRKAGEAGAIGMLCRALFAAGGTAQVQTAACAALAAACAPGDGNTDNARRAHSCGAVEAAAAAIQLHPKDGLVCVAACGLITLMLHALDSAALRSVNETGVPALLGSLMATFDGDEDVMPALQALQDTLAYSDDTYARVMRQRSPQKEDEVPEILVQLMDWVIPDSWS